MAEWLGMGTAPKDARDVPCGSCHRCCQGHNAIMLLEDEGDNLENYDYEIKTLAPGLTGPVLKEKSNGDCIYLGEDGCTIHDRAPKVCRVFDCRRWYLSHSRAERKRMVKRGLASKDVFDAGRERAGTLRA